MSEKSVEFFFDFGSPTAYLAYTQLPDIAKNADAQLVYRPMLLGGVFKATGNTSPAAVAAKGRWMNTDLPRWAKRYCVPFNFNPNFPINTLTLMRGAVGMQMHQPQEFERYIKTVFKAMWVLPRNLGDVSELEGVLSEAGFDTAAFTAMVGDSAVKAQLVANTEEAVSRGVFGAPTCFVDGHIFFCQDRLDFVHEALA
ncbi:2-hydroxychromene-2-carboxylate isomerase [Hydrogenophaga sp.]|uniref:2-hydroxychromene-2-carboxylate isomerase n=1 Tax=Hydrogenophaga sp. TaxID=1904254 RepID=UPI003561EF42